MIGQTGASDGPQSSPFQESVGEERQLGHIFPLPFQDHPILSWVGDVLMYDSVPKYKDILL